MYLSFLDKFYEKNIIINLYNNFLKDNDYTFWKFLSNKISHINFN